MKTGQTYQIVAIHGAPRSGTSWLGQLFNSSEHVAYRYQPFFSYAFKGRLKTSSTQDDVDRFFTKLLETQDEFVLQRGTSSLAGYTLNFPKNEVTHLVYKEVRHHDLLANVLRKVPEAKAIGIVRNPCAVIHSWTRAPREFDSSWTPIDEWRCAHRKNFGHPENWYGFERWKELAHKFKILSMQFPQQFSIVRYEDLVAKTEHTLAALFAHCNIEFSRQVSEFARASREHDDNQPYGVYRRSKSKERPAWTVELDARIIDAIRNELTGTDLEVYLG